MADTLQRLAGVPVLVCAADGAPVRGEREATDLIGNAFHHGADWIAVPVERLADDFFRLRTRVAGDIVQKFVNYRLGLAVLGDVSPYTAESTALRDFVRESNQGGQLWFLSGVEELRARLAAAGR